MKDYCKILVYVIAAELLTLFINLTLGFSSAVFVRIIAAVCTIGILAGLLIQAGYSIALTDKRAKREKTGRRSILLGITAVLPFQLCWILLLLARVGTVPDDFYRTYKLLCAPFLPVCNLFSEGISAAGLNIMGLCTLQLLSWIPFLAVLCSYRATLQGISIDSIMYK